MPLTDYQRRVCRLLASERVAQGESYIAGGAALNELLTAPRVSHDLDLFHDTAEAVLTAWETDRQTLMRAGHDVQPLREFPTFVEAETRMGADGVILQWVQDSAFRFFPLVEHPDFGFLFSTKAPFAAPGPNHGNPMFHPTDLKSPIRQSKKSQPFTEGLFGA